MTYLEELGCAAKNASFVMQCLSTEEKIKGIKTVAKRLIDEADSIIAGNNEDMEKAKKAGMSEALLDRLLLTRPRLEAISEGLIQITELNDPVGEVISETERPNGLRIRKVRVPMGVIGIIYESRPNVTADAFGLCFMTGNSVILRGGSDCIKSNIAMVRVIRDALESAGLPKDAVNLVEDTSRETATELMRLKKYVDLLIPRGGAGLIRSVVENATIPVIETGTGNCHVYVDESGDIDMAVRIIDNAKTQRMGVCNACESLLVHEKIAKKAIPAIYRDLTAKHIEIRAAQSIIDMLGEELEELKKATEEDWGTEYLGPVVSLRVVPDIDAAIEHINKYTTHHSEAIITADADNAEKFLNEVDAACVYVNASTRFTDGFEFGFGAEIGISTQKLHARGPMGLSEITSYKYKVYGDGQIRG